MPELEMRAFILLMAVIADWLVRWGMDDRQLGGSWKPRVPDFLSAKLWIKRSILWLEKIFNQPVLSIQQRKWRGVYALLMIVFITLVIALLCSLSLRDLGWIGLIVELVFVSFLLKERTEINHLPPLAKHIKQKTLEQAPKIIGEIIDRDSDKLDQYGVARVAIEKATVQLCWAFIAPAFWYLVAGLPGMLIYFTIEIVNRSLAGPPPCGKEFGWASMQVNRIVTFIPARITGLLIVFSAHFLCSRGKQSFAILWRDSGKHPSPDLGWSIAAMAGALGVALAGPRVYQHKIKRDPWINAEGRLEVGEEDIWHCFRLLKSVLFLLGPIFLGLAIIFYVVTL